MEIVKRLLVMVSIFVFLISCTPNPTDKQKEFAQKLLETPGILHTEWQTSLSLWIQVDLNSLGPNPKLQSQLLADQIAAAGYKYTQKDICANLYFGDLNQLASSCN